ncbi:sensor histidine kinase [Paenibacillus piri]|uniref:sensor histidine kinase n=1 Tax=Paenibacillus piri TaxID=2547395 RepID=UPI00140475C4|nr:sensor histidine kinase [Paenibacillus piri]
MKASYRKPAAQLFAIRPKTIRGKMFFTFILLTIPSIVMLGIISYYYAHESQKDKVETVSKQSAAQIQRNLDFQQEQAKNRLLSPYYNTEFIDNINHYEELDSVKKLQFHQAMRDFFSKNFYVPPQRDLAGFYIFLSNGELIYQTAGLDPEALKRLYETEDWPKRTVQQGGTVYFSGAYRDKLRGEDRYVYGASIMVRDLSSNRNMYSIIRAEYKFDSIRDMSHLSNLGSATKVLLLDGQSNVLYSTGSETPGQPWQADMPEWTAEAASLWSADPAGQRSLITGIRSTVSDWSIVLITPEKEIFEASIKIKQSTWIIALTALIVTAALSVLFSSYLTKPILALYKAVSAIRQGNMAIRAQVNRDDEIGKIAFNFNAMVDEIQHLITTKYVYQIKLREAELSMLYSQINPHFLYNTLDSIRSMADYYEAEEIVLMTTSLADMFRYSTTSSEMVTVEQELAHIQDYLNIQLLRFGTKISAEQQIGDRLHGLHIPKLTLQPLVENAIYHGLEKKKGRGNLLIQGWEEGDSIRFVIQDDGIGMPAERLDAIRAALQAIERDPETVQRFPSMGIGLINVHARLVLKFGAAYEMNMDSIPGQGTEIRMKLPRT